VPDNRGVAAGNSWPGRPDKRSARLLATSRSTPGCYCKRPSAASGYADCSRKRCQITAIAARSARLIR
jgi:hypothetical protein